MKILRILNGFLVRLNKKQENIKRTNPTKLSIMLIVLVVWNQIGAVIDGFLTGGILLSLDWSLLWPLNTTNLIVFFLDVWVNLGDILWAIAKLGIFFLIGTITKYTIPYFFMKSVKVTGKQKRTLIAPGAGIWIFIGLVGGKHVVEYWKKKTPMYHIKKFFNTIWVTLKLKFKKQKL